VMVRALLKMTETPEPADAADALAVALCHLQAEQTRARFALPDTKISPKATAARRRADKGGMIIKNPATILHEMRTIKTPYDIDGMERAVRISGEGHVAAMRYSRLGMHEYEIEAIIEFIFLSRGAQFPAYPSIVAGGANATVLHYTSNRDRVPDDALVLVDAGAEVDYYNGDVTRTWPM